MIDSLPHLLSELSLPRALPKVGIGHQRHSTVDCSFGPEGSCFCNTDRHVHLANLLPDIALEAVDSGRELLDRGRVLCCSCIRCLLSNLCDSYTTVRKGRVTLTEGAIRMI